MQKITKGILITLAISLVLSGCAINTGTKPTNKQAKKLRPKKNATSLDFNYPIDIRQEELNNHTIAILDPHIQADENVESYIKQFQSALVKQVQEVLEKKGYNIIHLTSAQNLTPEQKIKIYSVLKIKGWVGILEDADINIDNPEDTNMKTTVDQSAGAVLFQFFEPKTGRTTHNFAINVGAEHAITYSYLQQITSSDSFAGANSISLGAVSLVDRNQMDKNRDDAIHTILNKVYGVVIKKLISWVINTNLKQYRKVIDQIRK
ncbi:HpaA family protein [Helicobacter suis]|uniref:HpaA family protein n=1 Tax=Helicobacter suis TaxID=104628 RepID=UPI000CF10501|nr:HpaA family protein [Helicobacter suis]BCD49292.1 Neuraminyllactose-binding hemagglutinin [Helicobacter suis]